MFPDIQEKAKHYATLKYRILAIELALSGAAFLFVLFSGLGVSLRDLILNLTPDPYLSVLLYFAIGIAAYGLLMLPLTVYGGYLLPHRFELSTQPFFAWLTDLVKGGVLALILGGIIVEVLYLVLRTAPDYWWLIISGFMLLFTVVLANLSPILILPLFYTFTPLKNPELLERLERLTKNAKTRVNGIYTMVLSDRTIAANAAFMGIGPTKRIVLGDTLYENFTTDEIEVIIAHELAHQVNNDLVKGIAVQTVLTTIAYFLADLIIRFGITFFGFNGIADLAAMPLFGLAIGIFAILTLPLANGYSRWRETIADRYALDTTRNPQAFISAFERLAYQNLTEIEPEPWVEFLLYDHPTIAQRVAMGHAFETPA